MTASATHWQPLTTPPPTLSGLYEFSNVPPAQQVCLITVDTPGSVLVQGNITVTAYWHKIFAACASPSTPFEKSITITKGTESSTNATQTFGLGLGVAGQYGDISTQLSTVTSQSISFTASTTTTTPFSVAPKSARTTIMWWQKVYRYHFTGAEIHDPNSEFPKGKTIDCTIVNYHQEYIASQYPEPKGGALQTVALT